MRVRPICPILPPTSRGRWPIPHRRAVGAGILALPAITQSTGFYPSTALLLGSWAVLQLEALLIAEVNLQCHRLARDSPDPDRVIPLTEMVRMTVGPAAEGAVTTVYLTMAFTLLLAYTSRAGELLDAYTLGAGAALFTGSVGAVLARGGTAAAERLNSALTALLLTLFVGIVGHGASQVDWAAGFPHADWSGCAATLPVMFLALVYHDLIPVVCQYLGFDRRRVVPALLAGSVVPLGMFVAWQAVCLGLVPFHPGMAAEDPLDVLIASQGAAGGAAITLFSVAALMTSAIGTTLSLSSFFGNKLAALAPRSATTPAQSPGAASPGAHTPSTRHCVALLLTLVPPTAASMASTDIFLTATHLADAYGMTLLYGLMPPVLAWAARDSHGTRRQMLAGGRPLLAGLSCAGIAVGLLQLQQDLPGSNTAAAVSSAVQPVFDVANALPAAGEMLWLQVPVAASQLVASLQPAADRLVL